MPLDELKLEIYGNFLLLEHPVKSVVKISSKDSQETALRKQFEWGETIRSEGVLISPFISKSEKAVRDAAIDNHAKLILISLTGFPERYKPEGRMFELCSEGRLLIVAAEPYDSRKYSLTKEKAEKANWLASIMATLLPGSYKLI